MKFIIPIKKKDWFEIQESLDELELFSEVVD
jgi:hypothetical protein